MSERTHIPPALQLPAFNCAACGVYTKQDWFYLHGTSHSSGYGQIHEDRRFMVSRCHHCSASSIWKNDQMIYPDEGPAEAPNADMPPDVLSDYMEASIIVSRSPRGAAALLRLAIQKLCKHLGEPGKNINEDIKAMVANGLPKRVQQALDTVRVIGNEAVHPGTIDLNDNRDIALSLFRLVNFICEKMITEEKEVDDIFQSLPEAKRAGIESRDQTS